MVDSEKDSNHIDQQLHKACQLYNNGNYKESLNTFKEVCFTKFDVKEWIFENNILMCEVKMHLINDSCELSDNIVYQFRELMEKIRGLPSQIQTLPLELSIGLNYSFVLVAGYMSNKVMGGCFQAGALLTNNIIRAAQAHGSVVDLPDLKVTHFSKAFASDIMTSVLELASNVFEIEVDPNCLDLVMLNCWMLAVLWLSQHYVDYGIKMLEILRCHIEDIKETAIEQRVVLVDPSIIKHIFPLSLLPQASYHGVLKALVAFQTSLCFTFYQKDNNKALDLLNSLTTNSCSSSIEFYINYLKGYIHYEQDNVDKAMKYFIHCRDNKQLTEPIYQAASLCMTGRCLARQGKPHTAIAKFKEALNCSFGYLDALFYIAQQHQQLGQTDAEIQSLQYLCTALCACRDSGKSLPSLLHGPFIPFINNLYGKTISLTYALYWLGKRCLDLKRFSEASDAFIDVIAHVTSTSQPQFSNSAFVLPSLIRLHRDCAFALLKADQFKDCVTICDNALGDLLNGDVHEEVKDSAKRKRPHDPKEYEAKEEQLYQLELLLCKAYAVLCLDQPLLSLQCLQRFFDEVEPTLFCVKENKTNDSQLHKRRRLNIAIETVIFDETKNKQDETCSVLRIKSQAYMVRANVLQSMEKDKESLEELYQSILCDADNVSAVFQYSRLLFKCGSAKVAASNWLKYKELYRDQQTDKAVTSRKNGNGRLPSLIEVTDKEIQEIDNQATLYTVER